jgi:hypothetical protein
LSEALAEEPAVPAGATCAVHPDAYATFVCSRCGTFGCGECVFSSVEKREVCKACAAKGLGQPIAWEQRKELGTWRAFWETAWVAMTKPTAFFRTPSTDSSLLLPVVHGTLSAIVGLLLTYVILGLTMMLGGGGIAVLDRGEEMGPLGAVLGAYGCGLVGLGPVFALLSIPGTIFSIVLAAGASHGTLALFKKSNASFEDTLRAVSYASAPYVLSWIPLFGGMIAYVWMVWISAIAIRETHRCGTDWAVIATVGFRVILFLLGVGFYAAVFVFAFATSANR